MEFYGIVITGTSGSGKSAVARALSGESQRFRIVSATTTRKPRDNDVSGEYKYASEKEFEEMAKKNEFLVKSTYREEFYGISRNEFQKVVEDEKVPIIIITPDSVCQIHDDDKGEGTSENHTHFTVFVDADDKLLDRRLVDRGGEVPEAIRNQRQTDRKYKERCLYRFNNASVENCTTLIRKLWEHRKTGGVLPKRLIKLMIECGLLLEDAELDNVTGAAYDLSVGDEYYYAGKIKGLTRREPFILIEPYDYAIVTSREIVDLPRDMTGRFDLSVSLFCQGLILSNGPQVDPGFRGRLFCLLFNTSNAPVFLKRCQHYATIEFHKLMEPTSAYEGRYQGKEEIMHYLPSNTMRGAINELKRELEQIRHESRNLQSIFLAVTSLILSIIAILLVIR